MTFLDPQQWQRSVFTGSWVPAPSHAPSREPATGEIIGEYGVATPAAIDSSVGQAVRAQREWSRATYDVRARVLRKAAQVFVEHADEIAAVFGKEAGAARSVSAPQAHVAAEECLEAAALAAMPSGEVLRSRLPRLSMSRQVPVGVVGVIAPFNSPILLAIRAIAPALALGNAVVLKPDPRTAVCGGAVFAEVFREAGLPEGLLHVLPGGADVGAALVEHPRVPVIAFTGSTGGGKAIAAAAAAHLKRTHLELGGNSALVVLPDADVDAAANAGAWASFRHAGQICMAAGRHLVHRDVYPQYVEALAREAAQLQVGDPVRSEAHIGPIIDEHQRDHIHSLVTGSVDGGARLVEGGRYDGLFYRPTVLADCPPDSPAFAGEVFGPVASVVPFDTVEDAVRMAADSEYGLALSVFTRDVMAGLDFAEQVPAGLVHINDQTINDEPTAPFGGMGDSGNGSRHGGHRANLEAFTETQWVTMRSAPPTYRW